MHSLPLDVVVPLYLVSGFNIVDAYLTARRQQPARASGRRCPYCGHELDEDLDFCPWCTTRLAEEEERPEPATSR